MTVPDLLAEVLETGFRLVPFPARRGVRVLGRPGPESPIVVTGNYDLTVRRVRRALAGLDAYLVVADSSGVNVWCAASGGHLTTHQVVTAMKVARLEDRVVHREVILPQLAATGVEGKEVRRRTGWIARFGPADAKDLPAFLAAGRKKTEAMRRVRFGLRQRLEMAAAWATPISLVAALLFRHHAAGAAALVWGLALAVFLAFDRIPGSERFRQALFASGGAAACLATLWTAGALAPGSALGWAAGSLAATALLTFDFAGSTPTEAAGLFEERTFRVDLDEARCRGAYLCWAVCPEAVFEKREAEHRVAIARPEACIRCGACLVQCPQDALSFRAGDGRRVGPEVIRRYKLNLLGRRAVLPREGG